MVRTIIADNRITTIEAMYSFARAALLFQPARTQHTPRYITQNGADQRKLSRIDLPAGRPKPSGHSISQSLNQLRMFDFLLARRMGQYAVNYASRDGTILAHRKRGGRKQPGTKRRLIRHPSKEPLLKGRNNVMREQPIAAPESSAVRVALWRAMHVQVDAPPHVFEDEVGLQLVAPEADWRQRPDMDPQFTSVFRASIVARARFIEDFVAQAAGRGVEQYAILGAGLDTFAQRRPDIAPKLRVFEIDQPGPQAWKRHRLVELGFGIPDWLRFVPVDFEAGDSWWERLQAVGFDIKQPSFVAATGLSMYLTREAISATLRQVATLAPGSTLAMTFLLPLELADPEARPGLQLAEKGARASGTPFISFFTPEEMLALAREAGFKKVEHVSAAALAQRYFAGRADGLRPPNNSEEILLATT